MQNAGDKTLAEQAQPIGAGGIVGDRVVGAVAQAEMDMRAVADAARIEDRGKDGAVAEPIGDRPRHLALDHRLVGRPQTARRVDRHLVLPRAVFRQEAVGGEPSVAQRRHVMLGEQALAAIGVERIGRAGAGLDAGVDEFLLEGGEYGEAALPVDLLQPEQGAAQKMPRAAFPMLLVGRHDIAEIEPLGGAELVELDLDLGGAVGDQH